MSKRKIGLAMMIIGTISMAAALGLGGYNLWDDHRAGIQADALLQTIIRHQKAGGIPSELMSDAGLELLETDGYRYIGTVSIPAIDVTLPVQEDWGPAQMKISPCRYMGSPNQGDFIICAHNYAAHFGRLKNLLPGDEAVFTDLEGNEFHYTVAELEILADTAVEEMESGAWDLTLFTCTLGGEARVTVRCELLENREILKNN